MCRGALRYPRRRCTVSDTNERRCPTSRPKLLWLLALLTAVFSADVAHAQSARQLLTKGNKLFAAGNYEGAFAAFEAGNNKRPSPSFLRSMAFCKMKLYEHKAAKALFEQYLKTYKRAKDRKKLKRTLEKLEEVVATVVHISSTPSGADIYIDAEAAGKVGQTPKQVTIAPGAHTLFLRKAGFALTTKTFTIKSRQDVKLTVPMEVPLTIESKPSGAEVYVDKADGQPLGKTPLNDATIALGARTLFIKAKGFKTLVKKLDVKRAVSLTGADKLELGVAMRIESVPRGATVSIDGSKLEKVTPFDTAVTPGAHTITLSLAGFKDFEKTVNATPGAGLSLRAMMRGGLLTMRTGPTGAKVKLDGVELGKTPLEEVSVPLGTKTVELEHPSRRLWKKSLAFDDTTLIDAEVELGSPSWPFWVMAGTAAAAGIAGGALGLVALSKTDDYRQLDDGRCQKGMEDPVSCPYATHDASTGLLIGAGVMAAASLAYYLFWMRPSETIARRQRAAVAAKKRAPSHAPREIAGEPSPQLAL